MKIRIIKNNEEMKKNYNIILKCTPVKTRKNIIKKNKKYIYI